MIIKIRIPKNKNDKWGVNFKGRRIRRITALSIFNAITRFLQLQKMKEKVGIGVEEYIDGGWKLVNKSVASEDKDYLFYITALFLEDYLPKSTVRKVSRVWEKIHWGKDKTSPLQRAGRD
jgi:hypothetical protein